MSMIGPSFSKISSFSNENVSGSGYELKVMLNISINVKRAF